MPLAMEAKSSADAVGPTRHALYLNEVSHTLACHANAAAQIHGASFAKSVPSVVRWGDETPYGRPARVLWGQDTSRPASCTRAPNAKAYVPASYALSNPTCAFCAVPLVFGVNAQHRHKSRRASHTRHASLATLCEACKKPQRMKKPHTAAKFPAVRRRPPLQQLLSSSSTAPTSTAPPKTSAPKPTKTPEKLTATANLPPKPSAPPPQARPLSSHRASSAPYQDTKAGLRAMLQQKKQKDQAATKPAKSSGLADFLRQL